MLTCRCFEQLWSVAAAPPGDPEEPRTPSRPSGPSYQSSWFIETWHFWSHSLWSHWCESHLTFSVTMGVSLTLASQCLNVSVVSALSHCSVTTPDQSLSAEAWGCSHQAIGDPFPEPLFCVTTDNIQSNSAPHWGVRTSDSGHSVEANLHSTAQPLLLLYTVQFRH